MEKITLKEIDKELAILDTETQYLRLTLNLYEKKRLGTMTVLEKLWLEDFILGERFKAMRLRK